MANGHGGKRTPANPAPVSGPGALSQRTDGKPGTQSPLPITGGDYGEGVEMANLQASAPLAGPTGPPSTPSPGVDLSGITGMGADSEFPDEPITAGADFGDGPGASTRDVSADLARVKKYLPMLAPFVDSPDVPDSVRDLYRFVRDA